MHKNDCMKIDEMHNLIFFFYKFLYGPLLPITIIGLMVGSCLWGYYANKLLVAKKNNVLNVVLLVIAVCVILCATLMIRAEGAGGGIRGDVVLLPLHTLWEHQKYVEIYRVFTGNILIFIPFGALVYSLVKRKTDVNWQEKKNIFIAVLVGFFFSLSIEIIQYFFAMGQADVDDLICNTFGTCIGATLAMLPCKFNAKRENV